MHPPGSLPPDVGELHTTSTLHLISASLFWLVHERSLVVKECFGCALAAGDHNAGLRYKETQKMNDEDSEVLNGFPVT